MHYLVHTPPNLGLIMTSTGDWIRVGKCKVPSCIADQEKEWTSILEYLLKATFGVVDNVHTPKYWSSPMTLSAAS